MSNTISEPLRPLENRIDSVDIMRGVTILLMAFVNDLADFAPVKDLPQWLHHMAAGVNGFTFVDMIVPIFMFILGISIPLALAKRLARGESLLQVFGHVLIRTVSLIIIGLMDVNRGAGLGRPYGDMLDWPHGLWKFLAWTFVFIVWLDIPLKSTLAKNINRILKIAGLMGLVWLAIVFRNPSGGHFTTSWWATLGQLGWGYLFASITWLIFRNNRVGILGVFVLLHCMYIGIKGDLFQGVWLVNWIGASALGTISANAVAGLIIGTLLTEQSSQGEKIRRALGMGLFSGIAAFLTQPIGGLHSPSTSWSLSATGFAFIIWALLYWCIDVRGWKKGLDPLRTIGQNSLFLYQMSRYWIFIYWLTGLSFYETLGENTAIGITRAILYTVFLGAITVIATKKRVLLRV
jgi:heparan-alpha-glucosaminide N-acetyltransferase